MLLKISEEEYNQHSASLISKQMVLVPSSKVCEPSSSFADAFLLSCQLSDKSFRLLEYPQELWADQVPVISGEPVLDVFARYHLHL